MQKTKFQGKSIAIFTGTIVLVLATLLIINNLSGKPSPLAETGGKRLVLMEELVPASLSGSLIHCVEGLMLEAQGRNLKAKSIKGDSQWNLMMPSVINRVTSAGNDIVVFDEGKNLSYCNLQGKQMWSVTLSNDAIDVYTDENGFVLVEYKGMKGSLAEVFNSSGSKVGGIALENAHILGFAANGNAFSITILDLASETLKTKIITYDNKGDVLWANNFNDEIISSIHYGRSGILTAVSENKLYQYKNDGKLIQNKSLNGKLLYTAMSDHLAVIVMQEKGRTMITGFDANLKQQCHFEAESALLGIYPGKNSFILYTKDMLQHISMNGSLIASYKSNTDISKVYMTADNKFYIVSNKKLQLLQYR